MSTFNVKAFDAVAVSSTTTYYSKKTSLEIIQSASYHNQWAGTPNGTFTLWVSNKPSPSEADDTDWVQLTLARSPTAPGGAAGKDFVDVTDIPAKWIREKYVNSSSTGTISAWVQGKGP